MSAKRGGGGRLPSAKKGKFFFSQNKKKKGLECSKMKEYEKLFVKFFSRVSRDRGVSRSVLNRKRAKQPLKERFSVLL